MRMNIDDIRKYESLYSSARFIGSAGLLRDWLGRDATFPVPMSLAHGVDMNHLAQAMDVSCLEPIHWSYNPSIHERASRIKPSLLIQHPWLMMRERDAPPAGAGALIIGPPPGRANDEALLASLRAAGIQSGDLMLKFRGKVDESWKFWSRNGFNVVTAGALDDGFYRRLYAVIGAHDTIVSGTLSSAVVFAAALGKTCALLSDYFYSVYDTTEYQLTRQVECPFAKSFCDNIVNARKDAYVDDAQRILGRDIARPPSAIESDIRAAIARLTAPVQYHSSIPGFMMGPILKLSLAMGKGGLVLNGPWRYLALRRAPNVSRVRINEIDVWMNGWNESNFRYQPVPYVKNVTEPGWAVDGN